MSAIIVTIILLAVALVAVVLLVERRTRPSAEQVTRFDFPLVAARRDHKAHGEKMHAQRVRSERRARAAHIRRERNRQ